MTLITDEIDRLSAGRVIMDSLQGNLEVRGLDHPTNDMASVTGQAVLTAASTGSTITFSQDQARSSKLYPHENALNFQCGF